MTSPQIFQNQNEVANRWKAQIDEVKRERAELKNKGGAIRRCGRSNPSDQ